MTPDPDTLPARKRSGPKPTRPIDAVLDRWKAGETCAGIGKALDIDAAHVSGIVWQARRKGDPRAIRRRAPTGKPGTGSLQNGAWVPYWADPRQLPLPFPEQGASA
jgi:hypothetical protein